MTDKKLILIFEADPLVGEDLREMISINQAAHVVLFDRLSDLLTAVAKPECTPQIVFVAYQPERPRMEEELGLIVGEGAHLVLVDGLAARERQARTREWFTLSKPFNQQDVDQILSVIFSPDAKPDPLPVP